MTSEGSKSRIKWEGTSQKEIRSWPKDVKEDVGAELQRLENREALLMSKPMGQSLPGVSEIINEDKDFWYRLLYALHAGWIYVLHCFKKKRNKTSQNDIEIAKKRFADVKRRDDAAPGEEEKSA